MTSTDNNHTLILTTSDLIALSAAILTVPRKQRCDSLESARVKVRAALNGHIARNYEDDYGRIHRIQ